MATIDRSAGEGAALDSWDHVDGPGMDPASRTAVVHFRILETRERCTHEWATIDCFATKKRASGHIARFNTRHGIETLIDIDGMAWRTALSYRNDRSSHVEIFAIPGLLGDHPEGPSYAGRLSLVGIALARRYEFNSRSPGCSCIAIPKENSIMSYRFMSSSQVIGGFNVKPTSLDTWIHGENEDKDACVMLGIAFSIWRLIPCN